jgi:hypothetical protein
MAGLKGWLSLMEKRCGENYEENIGEVGREAKSTSTG